MMKYLTQVLKEYTFNYARHMHLMLSAGVEGSAHTVIINLRFVILFLLKLFNAKTKIIL